MKIVRNIKLNRIMLDSLSISVKSNPFKLERLKNRNRLLYHQPGFIESDSKLKDYALYTHEESLKLLQRKREFLKRKNY